MILRSLSGSVHSTVDIRLRVAGPLIDCGTRWPRMAGSLLTAKIRSKRSRLTRSDYSSGRIPAAASFATLLRGINVGVPAEAAIGRALFDQMGVSVAVIVKSARQFGLIVSGNPRASVPDPSRLLVAFPPTAK